MHACLSGKCRGSTIAYLSNVEICAKLLAKAIKNRTA